jgi:putative ABC transport system permease protein
VAAFWRDVRFGARSLRRARGFTVTAVVVLAIGIGAASTIFSLIDGALIRPLPFAQPDRLVTLWEHAPEDAHVRASPLTFLDWSEQNHVFASIAAVAEIGRVLTGITDAAEQVPAQSVTIAFFDVLGIKPIADALGIRILAGRQFDHRDVAASTPVCIVNEEFVRHYLQGREPLDAVVRVPEVAFGNAPAVARRIVGVVRQVSAQPGELDKAIALYVPIEQNAWYSNAIALRTDIDPRSVIQQARAAVAHIDADLPVTRVRTMDDVAAQSVLRPRFRAGLVAALAALALTLAGVGILGVLTLSVRHRTREFGVRRALGASRGAIMRLVLGEGVRIASVGVGIGVVASAALGRSMASLLYGVRPLDPISFLTAAAALAVTAIAACAGPALLAVRSDPAVTLRQE